MQGVGRGAVVGFCIGAAVGTAGAYLTITQLSRARSTSDVRHHALDQGLPRTEALKICDGYVAAFDFRTRNPKWVLEHITAESASGSGDRKGSVFYEDKDLEPWLRSKLADFKDSGYDRGHMAPAADHKGSQKAMNETFSLSNISPQIGQGFNRDYWARFEKFVKDLTWKCQDLYIVTGPLWMPRPGDDGRWEMRYPLIGQPPSFVSVPTHFFKVLLAKGLHKNATSTRSGSGGEGRAAAAASTADTAMAAFVMPNRPIDPDTPLSAFVVPLEPLEALAGTRFFPEYLTKERMLHIDECAQSVRSEALAAMKILDRQQVLEAVHPKLSLSAPPEAAVLEPAVVTLEPAVVAEPVVAELLEMTAQGGVRTVAGGTGNAAAKTARSFRGCAHLCEVTTCRLPIERFWERGKGQSSRRQALPPGRSSSSSSPGDQRRVTHPRG